MVATLAALTDAAAATTYYELGFDDYYAGDDRTASRWHGRAARRLGLSGEVEAEAFGAMLRGHLPDGTVLGTNRDGTVQHKLGWDLTMSAPKSLSTLALVAGDRRLLDAHDRAVQTALDFVERHGTVTRQREAGGAAEPVATGNMVAATFSHYTARATPEAPPDPQVHTHCVLLNATEHGGDWRSLESRALYRLQMAAGAIYHQELACDVRRLGYAVTVAQDGTFAIDDVPDQVSRAFSSRAAQIEAALRERGKTRAEASAAEKAVAGLETRFAKDAVDPQELVPAWRARADGIGFDEHTRRGIVAAAEARALAQPTAGARGCMTHADRAVAFAAEKLSERESTFSAAALEREAGDAAEGRATHADIVAAIARAERRQELAVRAAPGGARGLIGFATREAIQNERTMLRIEAEGRKQYHGRPVLDPVAASRVVTAAALEGEDRGHSWNKGQVEATRALLMSEAAVTALQGSAGTAKTTTALATYARAARAQGLEVRALAPTASAAAVLGRAIDAEPMTVAMLLSGPDDEDVQPGRRVDIVDEASMLSARDAARLLARAQRTGTRLVLVGDTDQLGSVEAGRAFGQLQQAGMETAKLDEIVRQTDAHTREAVVAMRDGRAADAFKALAAGGGKVIEQFDQETRLAVLARDFAALPRSTRDATLVLDPTREGRERLTDAIRAVLIQRGQLGRDAVTASILEPRGLTRAEAARAGSYRPGDLVTFRKTERGRPRAGVGYRVEAVDGASGTVRLVPERGRAYDWQPARWGARQAETFGEVEQEFRVHDRLQFTRNNYRAGRHNGDVGSVVAVDSGGSRIVVERDDGRRELLDLRSLADRHIRMGWVRTIHSSQGATCDHVMTHLESHRTNTVDRASAYVAISRARHSATIYTDSRDKLLAALKDRDGAQVGALDELLGSTRNRDSRGWGIA